MGFKSNYTKKGLDKPNPKNELLRQPPDVFLAGCSSAEPASAWSGSIKLKQLNSNIKSSYQHPTVNSHLQHEA